MRFACRFPLTVTCVLAMEIVGASAVFALVESTGAGRFDSRIIPDPEGSLDTAPASLESLAASDPVRSHWEGFRAANGKNWTIYLDRRSGAPLLVEGQGIPWAIDKDAAVESLEAPARQFMKENRALIAADDAELSYNNQASGRLLDNVWQLSFDHVVAGIPVIGDRFVFSIGHGKLISFGASRWSRIDANPIPDIDIVEAEARLTAYMGLTAQDVFDFVEKPQLFFLPVRAGAPAGAADGPYAGAIGAGYSSALVWKLSVAVRGDRGGWVGMVDAHTGRVWAFFDDTQYAQLKGGVYPFSNDQICPEGCEQPNYPMPFADIGSSSPQIFETTTSSGAFSCAPSGSSFGTALRGHYFRIGGMSCGLFGQSVTCDNDVNLGTSGPAQCTVPPGASAGDTHAVRTSFYHLNRAAEHARAWLPTIAWIKSLVDVQVDTDVDTSGVCDSYWTTVYGARLQYLPGNDFSCRNSGEIAGILYHEWGHGLDANDLGNFDSPSEAYADITSMLMTHQSCVGRGFNLANAVSTGLCSGYGNSCLSCTGVRDLDWDKRSFHTPSTPAGFVTSKCPGGGAPCGREVHCEGYLGGEMMWDLINRDLTAMGVDLSSAWQLADKLWFLSRLGSGGQMWQCALPHADGCFATSLFTRLRLIDDDDGNLANGTPHGGAIFAAFDRHGIACGAAADASNQNYSLCPTVGTVTPRVDIGNGSVSLSWTPVAHAAKYRILRNDIGCNWGSTIIADVTGTSYIDSGLQNGMPVYYSVQGLGDNASCDGALSACATATPEPFAGTMKLSAPAYNCNATVGVSIADANVGASTILVSIQSTTETSPESLTLTQIAPGSDTYTGSITLTSAAPAHDGVLSVVSGDTVTASYLEADDGGGHHNIPHVETAKIDCAGPAITKVQASAVSGTTAKITWSTDETATSTVRYGTTPPPASTTADAASVLSHAMSLSGLSECSNYGYSVESRDVVGNLSVDDASGAYYPFSTGKSFVATYTSSDTPIAIPDQFSAGATSTITVPEARTLQDIDVTVNVQHPFDEDLTFWLTAPTGKKILLASPHGGAGDNYTNTTFDDEAATQLEGSPPYTGSFRPDSPLSAFDGIDTAGVWRFNAVDGSAQDVGQILNWTLRLTYATPSCQPHAFVHAATRVSDSCATGGTGNANTFWDAGESVRFEVRLDNDGAVPLTGVTATATPTTPGVVMGVATASFPDIPAGGSAQSLSPHLTAHLPTGLGCGDTVSFQIAIHADQGTWAGSVAQIAGRPTNGNGRVLDESFDNGIPATWTVVNGGTDANAGSTWTAFNPALRTIAPPMVVPVVIVDSDAAGALEAQDDSLISPVLNLATATSAALQFDEYFRWFAGGMNEIGDVDVRSSLTGGAWVNVLRQQGASSANPAHESVDISSAAAGAADAQIRFHYWNGQNEQYWQLDNVTVDTSAPGSCDMPICAAGPAGAKPVPDGSFGTAMRASRADVSGATIGVTWDADLCPSADYHVLYGALASVASTSVTGAACDLGPSGSATWTEVPAGSLWFVVVGDDDATTEASWGTDGTGAQRGGSSPSGRCGMTTRDNAAACP
jgi:subtilisin-like proprotein convertase family protein